MLNSTEKFSTLGEISKLIGKFSTLPENSQLLGKFSALEKILKT